MAPGSNLIPGGDDARLGRKPIPLLTKEGLGEVPLGPAITLRWGLPLLVGALVLWVSLETRPAFVALGSALVAAGWVLACIAPGPAGQTLVRWIERHHRWTLAVALALVFAWGLTGALVRFHRFSTDVDLALFDNIAWNGMEGRPFANYNGNHLANHVSPVLLLTLPFYAVAGGPAGLLFAQSLALAAAALPLHALARRRLPPLPSLLLASAFLLLPGVFSQHLDDFHETPFIALPFFLALLFFVQGRFRPFLGAYAAASVLVIEYYTLALALFGLYALWRRRSPRWVLAPLAISLAWASLTLGIIMPSFRAQSPSSEQPSWTLNYYAHLGSTPGDILGVFLRDPLGTLLADPLGGNQGVRRPIQLWYLRDLFLPFLFALPFLSPEWVFALPELLKNLPTGYGGVVSLAVHHSVLASSALMAASVASLARLHPRHPGLVRGLAAAVLALAATSTQTTAAFLTPIYLLRVPPPPFGDLLALIDPEASVAAPAEAMAHFSRRRQIYYSSAPETLDAMQRERIHAIILYNPPSRPLNGTQEALRATTAADPAYRVAYEGNGVVLYLLESPTAAGSRWLPSYRSCMLAEGTTRCERG